MDNQHKLIKGYRDLTPEEIALMNEIKEKGSQLENLIAKLRGQGDVDQRWVSIGQTELQMGIMALVRSVAKPNSF